MIVRSGGRGGYPLKGQNPLKRFWKVPLGIQDYNTKYSGITPEMLNEVTTSLKDVQKGLLRLISSEDVLVGHVLENDLRALHMEHRQVTVSPKRSSPSIWPGCWHQQNLCTPWQVKWGERVANAIVQVARLGLNASEQGDPETGSWRSRYNMRRCSGRT